jgi:DNA-directed RNA polymerase specialized sigma24 family protein
MGAEYSGSVTRWIAELKAGEDSRAQQEIWNRYFARLAHIAHTKLTGKQGADVDEEDVALSALNSFFGRLASGKFPDLHDRAGLWPLLVTITARKAVNEVNRERATKRTPEKLEGLTSLEMIVGTEPSPSFVAEVADELRRLFALLDDDTLRSIARLKLEGYSAGEIAQVLSLSERTVYRKLDRIRSEWEEGMR